jgi:hypothetical protein
MADSTPPDLDQLRRENARLIELLEAHGIAWRSGGPAPTESAPISEAAPANGPSSTQEKVALFRRLFRGRDDVHALRWQSNNSGRSSYAPASTPCWRTTIATCWPSTLTSRTGVTMPGPFCARAGSWRCRQRWRSPALGKVLTCGCSLRRPYRRERLASWGRP